MRAHVREHEALFGRIPDKQGEDTCLRPQADAAMVLVTRQYKPDDNREPRAQKSQEQERALPNDSRGGGGCKLKKTKQKPLEKVEEASDAG